MTKPLLIAIAAGFAAALLYLSIATGSVLSMLLFYLAPLPLFVAGLGWGLPVATVASLVATGSALLLGPLPSFAFLISIGGPTIWLVRLALLSRRDADDEVYWYPPERLMLWAAALAAALVLVALPMIGYGTPAFRENTEALISQVFASSAVEAPDAAGDAPIGTEVAPQTQIAAADLVLRLLPTMAAGTWMIVTLANLWLAGRIARSSGRLLRPWPDLAAIDLRAAVALAFGAAIVLGFAPGMLGIAGQVAATVLGLAFLLLGLAVLHGLTRGARARRVLLSGIYLALLVMPWFAIGLIGLGLAEALVNIRARRGGPPPPTAVA